MLELVYGDMAYIKSVFGPGEITRDLLIDYFDNAKLTWTKVDFTQGKTRVELVRWCKEMAIKPLHYYSPYGQKVIWFKEPETAFLCRLKFSL